MVGKAVPGFHFETLATLLYSENTSLEQIAKNISIKALFILFCDDIYYGGLCSEKEDIKGYICKVVLYDYIHIK